MINDKIKKIVNANELFLEKQYKNIDDIAFHNQYKVLEAFKQNNIQPRHFYGSSGYGYDDQGKEVLAKVYSSIFGTESAIVSPYLSSGTQAITQTLLGILRPNDTIYSITGAPYDTLLKVFKGDDSKDIGSMKDFNIDYKFAKYEDDFDIDEIKEYLTNNKPKIVYLQRSRGYSERGSICIEKIKSVLEIVRQKSKDSIIVVDNCYGEFTEKLEPTDVGADVIVGSLIKNLGAGIVNSGGYICASEEIINLISYRISSPSLGLETGSFEAGYKQFFQGLFLAPHIVAGAKKGVYLCSKTLTDLGYKCNPNVDANEPISDIVCSIYFNDEQKLINFCRDIQSISPVDSNVILEPWDMPGYDNKVIMASGSFNQGSSIELSCDAPIKAPYIAYFQGGLTYEHIKIAIMYATQRLID